MSKVLVSGATGFVGRHLCESLVNSGHRVVGTTRQDVGSLDSQDTVLLSVPDLLDDDRWGLVLDDVDCVIHLAARVHVMRESAEDPLEEFRRINLLGTERLFRKAASMKVKRFIYLSSVKVHGESTEDRPFSALDSLIPHDPYAQSKMEAEQLIGEIGASMDIETVIIRPPLVYGPGVRGNFARLLAMVDKGIPLPFGLVNNSRSLVSVDNLCALISHCISHNAASGNRFLVSDNDDVSTPELIRRIASAMSRPARLLPVPPRLLALTSSMIGQSSAMSRLTGSLQVDISHTLQTLNWQPPISMKEGIQSTVRWYQEQKKNG